MRRYQILLTSQLEGEFEGFNDHAIFQLVDGSCYAQDERKQWYCYSSRPAVTILRINGRLHMQINGKDRMVAVRKIDSGMKSKINGVFRGWEFNALYELANGQIWQQLQRKYEYKYSYKPEVVISKSKDGYCMQVAGTSAQVRRVK